MPVFDKAVASIAGKERFARSPFGGRVIIHATAAETGGTFGMWETFVPPGQGPAPHTHTRETEVFRVIRGTFRVTCGDQEFEAAEGSVITLPPHVEHSWRNVGDVPGQMFGIATPAGFEQMFIQIDATNAKTEAEIARIETSFGIINAATKALASAEA